MWTVARLESEAGEALPAHPLVPLEIAKWCERMKRTWVTWQQRGSRQRFCEFV